VKFGFNLTALYKLNRQNYKVISMVSNYNTLDFYKKFLKPVFLIYALYC